MDGSGCLPPVIRSRRRPAFFWIFGYREPNEQFRDFYKYYILFITFLAYTAYHASRKPITVVKAQLHHNCTEDDTPHPETNSTTWCDWKPFDRDNYAKLFGQLDYAYLGAYAVGMFISGWVAERTNLRYFLFIGMVASGITTCAFGMGYIFKFHNYPYYLLVQVVNGIFQSTGWPGVVPLMGNWFGKGKRGLIMGVWNSHTSIGNIIGSLVAAKYATSDWMLSFVIPGVVIIVVGFLILLTVVPHPKELGYVNRDVLRHDSRDMLLDTDDSAVSEKYDVIRSELQDYKKQDDIVYRRPRLREDSAITFTDALKIPGVIEFSLCLFFAKLVSYTFLFWLPYYLSNSSFAMSPHQSGDYSTIFDAGGIIGGIVAGIVSDRTGKRALTVACMLLIGCYMLPAFQTIASYGQGTEWLVFALIFTGLLVNGPVGLITAVVAADLGTHPSLNGNSGALATVTSIIDGTGSMGAALGPFLVGYIFTGDNWTSVFSMLLICNVIAVIMLFRLVKKEILQPRRKC